jgi:hypothetical protein
VSLDVTLADHPPIVDVSPSELANPAVSAPHQRERLLRQSVKAGVGLTLACGLCCLAPLLAAAGFGTILAATATILLHPPIEAILAAGGGVVGVLLLVTRRTRLGGRRRLTGAYIVTDGIVCRLPPADRAQRTADFRALFSEGIVDRQRSSRGVMWALPARPGVEDESRRLAALEERCCDGITFEIRRDDDVVRWEIAGPEAAAATLDVLFDLPITITSDEGAEAVWRTLDAAACGSSSAGRS